MHPLAIGAPATILVASTGPAYERIARAIGNHQRLVHAETMSQGKALLHGTCDLIVCGLCFDESRMFDLLRHAKADEKTRRIPFVAVKATEGRLGATLQQSIEIACAALGAERFVELTDWEQEEGTEAAHLRLRNLLARLLEG